MGFPLEECEQAYAYMKPDIRESLHEQMVLFGSEYGLMNLTYPSIRRVTNYGLGTTVTAADLVHCIDAKLEAPSSVRLADDAEASAAREADEAALHGAFRDALGMLTCSGSSGEALSAQKAGIERSKQLLRELITCGNRVLAARQFEQLGDYYQVILRESVETEKFVRIQSLTKLALFLADALREVRGRGREATPLLIAAPKKDRTHLVVAVLGSARHWSTGGRNSFGNAFYEAARDPRVKARVAHESFEASVCVVASDDLRNFLEGVALNYDAV